MKKTKKQIKKTPEEKRHYKELMNAADIVAKQQRDRMITFLSRLDK